MWSIYYIITDKHELEYETYFSFCFVFANRKIEHFKNLKQFLKQSFGLCEREVNRNKMLLDRVALHSATSLALSERDCVRA